jgi:type I restriction-modification system DNA methylase subunit
MVDIDITNRKVTDDMSDLEYDLIKKTIKILTDKYGYPEDRISKLEKLTTKDGKKSTIITDLVVLDEQKKKPFIIVELKSPNTFPDRVQLSHYMKISGARFGFWYNGIRKLILESNNDVIVETSDLPSKKLKRSKPIPIENPDEKLWILFQTLRSHLDIEEITYAIILILYAKFVDEKKFNGKHFREFPHLTKDGYQVVFDILQKDNRSELDFSFDLATLRKIPRAEFSKIMLELRDFNLSSSNSEAIAGFFFDRAEDSRTSGVFSLPSYVLHMIFHLLSPQKDTGIEIYHVGIGKVIFELIQYFCDTFALTGKELKRYSEKFIQAYEQNKRLADLAALLLRLKDFKINIEHLQDSTLKSTFNNIIAFPPFGLNVFKHNNFQPEFGKQYENQLIVKLIQDIPNNGRIAIVLPPNFMFNRTIGTKRTHEMITTNCIIKAIIKLPSGIFQPTTSIGGVILFLEKNKRQRPTDRIFISDLDIKLAKNEILDQRIVDEILQKYDEFNKTNTVYKPTHYGFTISQRELIENDWFIDFQSKDLPEIPQHAQVFPLLSIAEIIPGRDYKQTSSDSSKEISQIRITDLKDKFVSKIEKKINVLPRTLDSKYTPFVRKNDIIFSIRGTIGKASIIEDDLNAIINSNLVIIRVDKNRALPHYLLRILSHEYVTHQLRVKTRGVYIQGISKSDLANLKIPLIPLDEQKRKLDDLLTLESDIENQRKRLEKLESKRNILLDEI